MNPSPAQIIEESRKLSGCSVDLGDDMGTHEFQLQRLAEIKSMIDQSERGTIEHAKLVERYNVLLYIVNCRLEHDQELLPANIRLSDDLMLIEYLDLAQSLETNGFYTLAKAWDSSPLIGVIDILPIADTFLERLFPSKKVSYRLVESLKGVIPPSGKLERYESWGRLYQPDSRYVVFWDELSTGSVWGQRRWKFDSKSDSALVETNRGKHFWPFEVVAAAEFTTTVRWQDLRDWAMQQARKPHELLQPHAPLPKKPEAKPR